KDGNGRSVPTTPEVHLIGQRVSVCRGARAAPITPSHHTIQSQRPAPADHRRRALICPGTVPVFATTFPQATACQPTGDRYLLRLERAGLRLAARATPELARHPGLCVPAGGRSGTEVLFMGRYTGPKHRVSRR